MTYSSALFETGQESLEQAQIAKYASMIDQMGVSSGDHVLEIGCGSGGILSFFQSKNFQVYGLDYQNDHLDYAKKKK